MYFVKVITLRLKELAVSIFMIKNNYIFIYR